MKETDWFWYTVIGVIYLAIVYGLVKPGSPAAGGVTAIAAALSSLITTATGNTNTPTPPGETLV
jgi:hypothetical protein